MTEHERETRNGSPPPPQQPSYGFPPPAAQQYGRPAQYGQYGQYQPYGQPAPYGPPAYAQYGQGAVPAKPAHVVVPGVLGFVFGAFGVLVTLALLFVGLAATGRDSPIPRLGTMGRAVGGVLIVVGVLALAWTVLMIWGSVWALIGRSRVLLLVGGSISIATTGLVVLAGISSMNDASGGGPGGVLVGLAFFLGALAIVILLSMRPAAQFYAAHRARRGR